MSIYNICSFDLILPFLDEGVKFDNYIKKELIPDINKSLLIKINKMIESTNLPKLQITPPYIVTFDPPVNNLITNKEFKIKNLEEFDNYITRFIEEPDLFNDLEEDAQNNIACMILKIRGKLLNKDYFYGLNKTSISNHRNEKVNASLNKDNWPYIVRKYISLYISENLNESNKMVIYELLNTMFINDFITENYKDKIIASLNEDEVEHLVNLIIEIGLNKSNVSNKDAEQFTEHPLSKEIKYHLNDIIKDSVFKQFFDNNTSSVSLLPYEYYELLIDNLCTQIAIHKEYYISNEDCCFYPIELINIMCILYVLSIRLPERFVSNDIYTSYHNAIDDILDEIYKLTLERIQSKLTIYSDYNNNNVPFCDISHESDISLESIIHPTSKINGLVVIHDKVIIHERCNIGSNSIVEKDVILYPRYQCGPNTVIGSKSRLRPNLEGKNEK